MENHSFQPRILPAKQTENQIVISVRETNPEKLQAGTTCPSGENHNFTDGTGQLLQIFRPNPQTLESFPSYLQQSVSPHRSKRLCEHNYSVVENPIRKQELFQKPTSATPSDSSPPETKASPLAFRALKFNPQSNLNVLTFGEERSNLTDLIYRGEIKMPHFIELKISLNLKESCGVWLSLCSP